MEKPLVSICCITYNHEHYIKDALDGFIMQNTNFLYEIVISDDCSKEGTRKVIEEYKKKYPSLIRDVSPEKNMGSSENFIYVQQCAKGKYIAICEGDDYWTDPLKLQKQVDILEADETLMACCTSYSIVDNHSKIIKKKNEGAIVKGNIEGRYTLRDFFRDDHRYPTLTMVYRNIHGEEIREKYAHMRNPFLGDWTLWICLLIYGDMYYLDEVTSAYRINPTSITHTTNRVAWAKASRDICPKVADILPEEYADISKKLRDTRWVWVALIRAYKAERRYFLMIWSVMVACIICPEIVWHNCKKRIESRRMK